MTDFIDPEQLVLLRVAPIFPSLKLALRTMLVERCGEHIDVVEASDERLVIECKARDIARVIEFTDCFRDGAKAYRLWKTAG